MVLVVLLLLLLLRLRLLLVVVKCIEINTIDAATASVGIGDAISLLIQA